ncbi:MAG: helix-turn-helix domain-containing protein [Rhodopila sp.]
MDDDAGRGQHAVARGVVQGEAQLAFLLDLTGGDLPPELESVAGMAPRDVPAVPIAADESNGKLADSARAAIATAIRIENGNLTRAAIRLGIAKSTLYEKMKRFGIDRSQVQALQRDPLAEGSMRRS